MHGPDGAQAGEGIEGKRQHDQSKSCQQTQIVEKAKVPVDHSWRAYYEAL
jgi:hypothetical protein